MKFFNFDLFRQIAGSPILLVWLSYCLLERSIAVLRKETEFQIHLAMDTDTFEKLEQLRDDLGAASFSEVVRRALQAVHMMNVGIREVLGEQDESLHESYDSPVERNVKVRIPESVKKILDSEKASSGLTYSDIINASLGVLSCMHDQRSSKTSSIPMEKLVLV